jgi:hypothetical protein
MLDDVERRAFLVQPAREDALELVLWIAHVELQERAGQLLLLPGRGRFAGTEPNDHVADAKRFARLHRQVARNAVALVQQADDGDAFGHRRRARCDGDDGLRHVDGDRFRLPLLTSRLGRRIVAAGGRQRRRQGKRGARGGVTRHGAPVSILLGSARHDQSGVQAS